MFNCGHCDAIVVVHRGCDRGNRYCSTACASSSRAAEQRWASARYQATDAGRAHHAERQRAYRARLRVVRVTQHTPPSVLVRVTTERLDVADLMAPPSAATLTTPANCAYGMLTISLDPDLHGHQAVNFSTCVVCGGATSAWLRRTRAPGGPRAGRSTRPRYGPSPPT